MQCTKGFYTEQRKLNYLDSVTCGVQIDTNLTEAKCLATVEPCNAKNDRSRPRGIRLLSVLLSRESSRVSDREVCVALDKAVSIGESG